MTTYSKQTWHDLPATDTPLSAERLGHMEDGIAAAVTGSNNGTTASLTLWKGTAAQYAAIGTKDANTVYCVVP